MSKNRSPQIQPCLPKRLTLSLVYCHAESKSDRVLDATDLAVSDGVIFNLGMKTLLPALSPVRRQISITLLAILVTIPLEPLQTPS
jgi:hypothetical protein